MKDEFNSYNRDLNQPLEGPNPNNSASDLFDSSNWNLQKYDDIDQKSIDSQNTIDNSASKSESINDADNMISVVSKKTKTKKVILSVAFVVIIIFAFISGVVVSNYSFYNIKDCTSENVNNEKAQEKIKNNLRVQGYKGDVQVLIVGAEFDQFKGFNNGSVVDQYDCGRRFIPKESVQVKVKIAVNNDDNYNTERMPYLYGLTEEEANCAMENAGFKRYKDYIFEYNTESDEFAKGLVCDQKPYSESYLEANETAIIQISK